MGHYRFRRSVKILPGVRVNINAKSTSVTFGGKGFTRTVSSTGRVTNTIGIPGTGIHYTEVEKQGKTNRSAAVVSSNSNVHPSEAPKITKIPRDFKPILFTSDKKKSKQAITNASTQGFGNSRGPSKARSESNLQAFYSVAIIMILSFVVPVAIMIISDIFKS
nr:DUF4236 domain-containing protein [uncultured Sphaerochaeta sp.]